MVRKRFFLQTRTDLIEYGLVLIYAVQLLIWSSMVYNSMAIQHGVHIYRSTYDTHTCRSTKYGVFRCVTRLLNMVYLDV